jgi:hypothetical protein
VVFLIPLSFFQVTERFGELAGLPADIIPVLSEATLDAISQGRLSIFTFPCLILFAATLSSSTQDLGQDFVLNNTQIMQVAFILSNLILSS